MLAHVTLHFRILPNADISTPKILGHYTTVNIAHCLEGLTTSIAVISGKNAPENFEKAEEYCNVLPSIEHIEIAGCGLLPQRENLWCIFRADRHIAKRQLLVFCLYHQ